MVNIINRITHLSDEEKGDKTSIGFLNNIRVGECSEDKMKQSQLRKIVFHLMPL